MMHAALRINIPNYASAVVTTKQVIESHRSEPWKPSSRTIATAGAGAVTFQTENGPP
jgi:hypothetical protein